MRLHCNRRYDLVLLLVGAFLGLAVPAPVLAQPCEVPNSQFVTVIVDMDANEVGCQSRVIVPEGTTVVRDVAVYVMDPTESRSIRDMGYLGGIDRGLAFGHTPTNLHQGTVSSLEFAVGTAVHPENVGFIIRAPGLDKGFAGPEIQYSEFGSPAPAVISANPSGPIFTVDIHLEDAQEGDVFAFHLLDYVTLWSAGIGGVFSTTGSLSLDTGGDAVADGTVSLAGVDADAPISVPPAAFQVDLVDGPASGGPATIEIVTKIPVVPTHWSVLKARFGG